MRKIIEDIKYSFKKQPLWTTYSLLLSPFYYILVALTSVVLGLINLDVDSVKDFWDSNT